VSEADVEVEGGLGSRAARGAAVTLGAQGIKILVQTASLIVLARLLSPTDYGLITMVVAIIGVGEIFRDFGLSSAAIQAPTLSRGQRDNLQWINTGIGIVLAALVFAGAGLIAQAYDHEQLVPLAQVLSVTFIVNGFATQYRADLIRRMRFRALAVADVGAPVVALGVAIVGALLGWGYWALAAQQLVSAVVLAGILVATARWLPGLPRRGEPMRDLIRFGWNLVGSQLVGYISNNVDSFIIGRRFGAEPLGLYNRAFQLLMTPLNQVRSPLTTVALPVLSRLSHDNRRFGDYVAKGQVAMGYTIVIAVGFAGALADPLVRIVLGERWASVAPILFLLAIAAIFQTLAFVGYWVYVARGLTAQLFRYSTVSAVIRITLVLLGSNWGVLGVAAAFAIAPAISWPISLLWLSRTTTIPTARLYAGAGRIITVVVAGGAPAALVAHLLAPWGAVAQLTLGLASGLAVLGVAALVIPPIRRDVADVVSMVRLLGRRRARPRS
jgi:PST family polysaccharide transporter